MKKLTVSIGIPAYNEEGNIKYLVEELLKQRIANAVLLEIIVVSDGSSDSTVNLVRSIRSSKVKIVDRKKRLGLNRTQNEILSLTSGDILVLMDADVLPLNNFLQNIISPILRDKKVGLVGADIVSAKPRTFFEKVISDSHDFKYSIYRTLNGGDNAYVCHGRASAFSKALYSKVKWPDYPAEDVFAYLTCIESGYKFVFAKNAQVLFRLPGSLGDHIKQSQRFFGEKAKMERYFSAKLVRERFYIPWHIIVISLIKSFIRNPLTISIYLTVLIYIRFVLSRFYGERSQWKMSMSTKIIK